MSAAHAVDVRVTGTVQGVFFRDGCRREAERLGVSGWARNEPDGSVAVHAEGERDAVDSLVDWCRTGSPKAEVDAVDVSEAGVEGCSGFRTG